MKTSIYMVLRQQCETLARSRNRGAPVGYLAMASESSEFGDEAVLAAARPMKIPCGER